MTNCIKCGRPIPDGELFCSQCSKSPVIAELDTLTPKPQMKKPAAPKPRPMPQQRPVHRGSGKKLKTALAAVSALLVLVLGILVFQQGKLQVERNRVRTRQDELSKQMLDMERTTEALEEKTRELEQAQAELAAREKKIKELEASVAAARSSQNQGQYDLTQVQQELEELQTRYAALESEVTVMEEAVQAAAGYKEKAEFLDSFVVFAVNDGSKLYHTYDCAEFDHTNFWTYSPKLARSYGFKPCPACIE